MSHHPYWERDERPDDDDDDRLHHAMNTMAQSDKIVTVVQVSIPPSEPFLCSELGG